MAGSLGGSFSLTPSSTKAVLSSNYLSSADFNFLNQYLPDTVKDDFEVYGNRSVSSFLRLVGAEEPSASDLIKWSEQGRLHTKYTSVATVGAVSSGTKVFDIGTGTCVFRVGQVVILSSATAGKMEKGIITALPNADQFTVAFYSNTSPGFTHTTSDIIAFVYGSEFKKGTNGMSGSLEAESTIREVKPVIIKDHFEVSGSDMAQIGWIEIEGENGNGFLWYLRSEHETRMRFDDYLEMMMIEHRSTEAGSGAATALGAQSGTEGFFEALDNGGNIWSGGNPSSMADVDTLLKRLDKNAAIQENVFFVDRDFSIDMDDMLAAQNSYGVGGTSYGMFNNEEDMAINLGFSGFRRGTYDFYKTDWKYLNDASTRGGLVGGKVNGVLVPAGEMSVYDQVMGQKIKRPFLHVRYRTAPNGAEDRRYKTWINGGAGGANNSDLDALQVEFLSERAICTVGRNNFMKFED